MDGRADGPTGGWSCVFWSGCNGCRKVVAVTKPGDHFDLGFPRPVPLSVRQRPAWCFPTPLGARSKRCLQLKMKHARNTAVPNPLSVPKATSWSCPLCDYSTGNSEYWRQRKSSHIKAWHPDQRTALAKNTSAVLLEWTPDCVWKCPHCNLGIPAHFSSQVRREARIRHGKSKHPEVDQKVFHAAADPEMLRQNCKKASLAKIAAGVARRLLDVKSQKHGDHNPTILELPVTGNTTKKRNTYRHVFCKKWTAMAVSIPAIAKVKCDVSLWGGSPRARLVARLQELCQNPAAQPKDVELARKALPLLEAKKTQNRKHIVQRADWPLPGHTYVYFCKLCREAAFGLTGCALRLFVKRDPGPLYLEDC